ncbi:RDD family protein [Nocardioides aurantiacus]|uniref:RDD family protein n=1 Tax=Nocardioides aurantiacus TaxID=86796 RepID=UPI00403EFCD4
MTELATHVDAPCGIAAAQVELAGWWRRLAAFVIDTALTGAVVVALTLPWVRDVWSYAAVRWAGFPVPSFSVLLAGGDTPIWWRVDIEDSLLVILGAWLAVTATYQTVFLRWRGATPGKLALGLRVRLLDRPGPLPARAIGRRLLVQLLPAALAVTAYCSALGRLVPLLGALAALRDDRRQAWHDLAAGTCVVRVRASGPTWDPPAAAYPKIPL